MLSTENPPPDLCGISQLKSSDGGSDERASDNNRQQLEVDLLKSGLDYNNPVPKFSIRDYVFKTRGKDIKNNWPFSQKNLQVCLKHGVKDVLPPFQSLDSVRNPSIVDDSLRCSDQSDGSVCERPAVNIDNINSSECEEDKEFPSTTTSQSCSDMNSVPPIRNEPEAQYLLRERPEVAVRECKKAESNTRGPAKKCRLILKLNNIAEPKSAEDSAASTPVVSEAMASKVCPVCKTFSSSSNTTLNAHIDQCLSGESVKLTANSKVIKHRIKPRKTRLMVDIYETALHSTLEDLDIRNGTNWASNMGLHSQDLLSCAAKEGKKAHSPDSIEDINHEGDVYIDSSGTKLRILSKLCNPPSKPNIDDTGPCKFVKRDTVIKLLSSKKKKKKHTIKNLDLRKSSLDGQGSCSPIPDLLPDYPLHGLKSCYPRVEVDDVRRKIYLSEGHKDDNPVKSPIPSDHMKSDDFGMIKQWVGSKRTGLKKKISLELENQLPDKSLKYSRTKSASSLVDRGNSGPICQTSSDDNPVLPPEGHIGKENLSRSHDGRTQLLSQRKELGFSSLRSDHVTEKKSQMVSSKFNAQRSRKDSTSFHKRLMDPPNSAENLASSHSDREMGISSGPAAKNDSSFIGSSTSHHHTFSSQGKNATLLKKLSLGHANSSGGKKFSSLRSKLLSVRHASGAQLKKNTGRELLNSKSPKRRYTLLSDEEAVVSQSTLLAEDTTLMEEDSGELLTNSSRVLKIHKKIGGLVETDKGDMTSETSTESDTSNAENETDSFTSGSVPIGTSVSEEEGEMLDDFVREPTSTDGDGFASFSKSMDSAFSGLAGSNVECVSQYYSKEYDMHCPAELVFHADQEMFCADNAGKDLVTRDTYEMDGDRGQGNYFVDVEPIPIPGPPGSFLPSPGRMGSEELLGHSSLNTCRIQSSDDGHEVVDMDSSDSPVSAMSTVSNSVAGRSSSISTANLSAQSHFKHASQLDTTKERINPVVEGSPHFEQIASRDRELNLLNLKANLMLPEANREVQNIQPCCCSRKDASLQGGGLNYQESQILRRRTRTSVSVLALEKQVNDDTDNEIGCYDLGAAEKEPTPVTRKDLTDSPNGYTHVLVPHGSEAMFRACGDCEFPSPSTSNSVLRLMGKNLMVVNKDDTQSPITRPSQIEHPAGRLCVDNGLSTRSNPNEPNSFHHMFPRGPSMFDSMEPRIPAQQFDFNSSNAFKIPTNHRPSPKLPSHPSPAMFSGMSFGGNVTSAEYAGGFSLMTDQLVSNIRPVAAPVHHHHHHHLKTRDSSSAGKHQEIIIIDDTPESDAGLAVKAAQTHCSTNTQARESVASAILLPPDSRHVNPFYSYRQTQVDPQFTGSAMTANLGKWVCIPEGSDAPLHSSASLPSSSVQLRSSVYFSS